MRGLERVFVGVAVTVVVVNRVAIGWALMEKELQERDLSMSQRI